MKKLILSLSVVVFLLSCGTKSKTTSNKSDSSVVETAETNLSIEHQHDEIEDKHYYAISKPLTVLDGNKGFTVSVFFKKPKEKIVYQGLAINSNRFGGCVEDAILYILFQDGTKLQVKQWNDFNCEGNIYLDFNKTELKKLNKPIKAVKLVNGRGYESFDKTFTDEQDVNYFTNVLDALNNQRVIEVKELTGY
jgi:hypothetical protein